jgi:hypothetical protein
MPSSTALLNGRTRDDDDELPLLLSPPRKLSQR